MQFSLMLIKQPWDDGDAEFGDPSLPRVISEIQVDFSELLKEASQYSYAANGAPIGWLVDTYDDWSQGGRHTVKSMHLLNKDPRAIRYWYTAIRMCGIDADPYFFTH